MLPVYLKLAFRNLQKSILQSTINISSLAFGVASCLLIFLFIQDEKSFDGFHSLKDRIYRLNEIQTFTGTNTQHVALSMPGMGPNMAKDYPEVEMYTRFIPRGKQLLEHDNNGISVDELAFVDSTFLQLFNFPLTAGDPSTVLNDPNTIILTENVAKKIFGSNNPIGQSLKLWDQLFEVNAVLKNIPDNSHLQFDALISTKNIYPSSPDFNDQFGNNFLNTYLLMKPEADIAAFNAKMPDFIDRYMPPSEDNPGGNQFYKFYLQPLEDVHLASMHVEHDYKNHRKFNGAYLDIFIIVGIFILLIAAVNFMNLITARASYRWKEVGVRKTVGALKRELFSQFMTESFLLALLAFIIGIGLAMATLPLVNSWMGRSLSMFYYTEQPIIILGALVITLALGFLASIYPAIYLTSFKTIDILKGGKMKSPKSSFRNALVVIQFGLAIAMIVSTIVVIQQLDYIQNKDVGFNKDHIVLVSLNETANNAFAVMKEELLGSSNILGVTASGQRIGNNFHQWSFKVRTDSVRSITPSNLNVDYDYLEVYDINLKEGRSFSKDHTTDNGYAFIINELFAKELALDKPIGVKAGHGWYPDDSLGTIIGVTEDFHFNSLHYEVNTLAMVVHPDWGYDEMSVKLSSDNVDAALADIERVWNQHIPDWPFEFSFLDEHFSDLYRSDQQMKAVVWIMALLAILIACMGLFGLAAISMQKRVKEIGLRKILGASMLQITIQLTKIFGILIVLAFIIFCIPTWLVMSKWLQSFAYRIEVSPFVFLLGFFMALLVAFLTLSYHTLKVARANPVEALRYE